MSTSSHDDKEDAKEHHHKKHEPVREQPARIAGQEVGSGVPMEDEIDLIDRDPKHMNDHLKLKFADVFAEPDPGIFSFDQVWVISFQIFTATKLWTYRIATLLCAIPAAFCWGLNFACISFHYIWCMQPAFRAFSIQMVYTRRIYTVMMNSYVLPFYNAAGYLFSRIRVTTNYPILRADLHSTDSPTAGQRNITFSFEKDSHYKLKVILPKATRKSDISLSACLAVRTMETGSKQLLILISIAFILTLNIYYWM